MKKKLSILLCIILILSLVVPTQAAVKTVKVNLKAGKTVKAYAIKGAQKIKLDISGKSYTWKSSRKTVATVTKKGAVTLKSAGTTSITATKGKKKYTLKLTVETPSLSRPSATVREGERTVISVKGTKQKITYASTNNSIATVTTGGIITGVSYGVCQINATIGNAKTLSMIVNVVKKTITPTPSPTPIPTPTPSPSPTPTPVPEPVIPTYAEGQYRVGIDIPAGTYVFYAARTDFSGYYCESSDANGDNIIDNENFEYNSIYAISPGNYLKMSRCYAIPLNYNPHVDNHRTGTFIVGIHLPAGTYRLTATRTDFSGYYCIYEDAYKREIVANDLFSGNAFCTVENGQVLVLSRAVIDW